MERFTNTELVDMHLIYRLADGNARVAERLYHKRNQQRDAPDHRMIANSHHNLSEYGSLRGNRYNEGGPRGTPTSSIEQNGMNTVRRNLSTSVRAITAAVKGSWSSVHCVLQREGKPLHSYHFQRVPSQIVIQISKHLAVRSISLGVPFTMQSFCCS
ncbi:DUF4817 domain-containing protein [Trichonephila clavipes]|nr:DUF4817 domain-containing protein [Trichonephila clavipes]